MLLIGQVSGLHIESYAFEVGDGSIEPRFHLELWIMNHR